MVFLTFKWRKQGGDTMNITGKTKEEITLRDETGNKDVGNDGKKSNL